MQQSCDIHVIGLYYRYEPPGEIMHWTVSYPLPYSFSGSVKLILWMVATSVYTASMSVRLPTELE